MSDSLTLILEGQISLGAFAKAIQEFDGLVTALSHDVSRGAEIKWVVSALSASSAIATAQGLGSPDVVEPVVRAYERVGESLERFQTVPYSRSVRKRARNLVSLINGEIETIRFETDQRDVLLRQTVEGVRAYDLLALPVVASEDAYGAVEGKVETLARRGGLRFMLYDAVQDKAVSCYLAPGYEDIMRNAWGNRAIVFGRVHRDPLTGRPLTVRHVTAVEVVREGERGDWRKARGAFHLAPDVSSVDAIRAIRDA